MSRDDWFRHREWNEEIEAAFYAKLQRARKKCDYLRIQASYLTKKYPQVSLRLLKDYFARCENHFDLASAYEAQARAYQTLEDWPRVYEAYEKTLRREQEFLKLRTQASLDYPWLIIERKLTDKYPRAQEILEKNVKLLIFPVDFFRYHYCLSMISHHTSEQVAAVEHAREALSRAGQQQSGFQYHQATGLVGLEYHDALRELKSIFNL